MKKEKSSLNSWTKLDGLCLTCSYWVMYRTHIQEYLLLFQKDLIGKSTLRFDDEHCMNFINIFHNRFHQLVTILRQISPHSEI